MALFPVVEPKRKTPSGEEAFNPKGLVPRAAAALKKHFPELGIMSDVALDPFTSHGQDGVIDDQGYILNDVTLDVLVKQALVQASVGGGGHRCAVGHDGWPHRQDPRRARRPPDPYEDHGLFRQVRLGLIRALPRRGRSAANWAKAQENYQMDPANSDEAPGKWVGIWPKAPTW